ncbi:Glycerate kinase [Psychromonas ingrahamii 37]|uniref:Glycerate kinase n=1 Tax=Psychromonas ingrahamii (strain DSM 17664 / CCUG 51855 / 37) TaxID=357804 RepID=A1SSN3_PSYIN|nr:glycerate kinase [Psychromonas ingrahamii]ABM02498.1 Glycerate kinase [Psychromonas ingrahamii 37]
MKIVIAPDSFKESLSAMAVATCIENGFSQIFPDCEFIKIPLADGGEGTVDVLVDMLKGKKQYKEVKGPISGNVNAVWALLNDGQSKTALIEIAAASGLDLITPEQRNPLISTSFGTGQIILQALDSGANKIIIGLGGSASNDGGAGILQALGGQLLNAQGNQLTIGGAALEGLAAIDLSKLDKRCADVEFIVACDVSNPLTGDNGASRVFGPQKGATPEMVELLDSALSHFADIAAQSTHIKQQKSAGFGAAGGAPLGLSLAFNIKIQAGIDMVLDILQVDDVLQGADLVITGEGQMDNQTLNGKTPYGIAKRAQARGIPVIAIAGSLGTEVEGLYENIGSIFGTVRSAQPLAQVLSEAEGNLTRTARNIAATLLIGNEIYLK